MPEQLFGNPDVAGAGLTTEEAVILSHLLNTGIDVLSIIAVDTLMGTYWHNGEY